MKEKITAGPAKLPAARAPTEKMPAPDGHGHAENHQVERAQAALKLTARLVRIGQRLFNGFGFQPLHAYPQALGRFWRGAFGPVLLFKTAS
jgi:hypothetical protein